MDSITQAVLGAAIAEAGFRKDLGRGAVFFGALCGTMPDFDVFTAAIDPWFELQHHRGVSHSLVVLPFVAPIVGWAAWRLRDRRSTWQRWSHCAFWALITHPLLDVCTSYGTQLLAPLSNRRFAIDWVSIVDPVFTVPLIIATVMALRRGDKARRQHSRTVAMAAVLWGLAWLGIGGINHSIVAARARAALSQEGVAVDKLRVAPTLLNHLAFRVVARDRAGDIHVSTMSLLADIPPSFTRVKSDRGPAVDLALAHPKGALMTWFSDGLVSTTVRDEGDRRIVRIDDMRYGLIQSPSQSLWGAEATIQDGVVVDVVRVHRRDPQAMKRELSALWSVVWTGLPEG